MSPSKPLALELDDGIFEFVAQCINARTLTGVEHVQALWNGHGRLLRIRTDSLAHGSVVLKQICLNPQSEHPRGWNTNRSFSRKVKSYEVECCWYQNYAHLCGEQNKVPTLLGFYQDELQSLILLEDLSAQYPRCCTQLSVQEVLVCLRWLASFHAAFMGHRADGLWEEGCYWHLGTRPDEFELMPEGAIKQAAAALDNALRSAKFQTVVHGDAKVANFCFSNLLTSVAAVDFQYIGRGCGMRDVIYLLGSCLNENDCQTHETYLLNAYFESLITAMHSRGTGENLAELEAEWRGLYAIAWTDFYRFLLGWSPSHPKINQYTRTLAERALHCLDMS